MGKVHIFFVCCILLCLCCGTASCGKRDASEAVSENASSNMENASASAEKLQKENAVLCPEMQRVVNAVEAVSEEPSFRINTDGQLCVENSLIQRAFEVHSEVHIAQGENHSDLRMSMHSDSDLDPVQYACYQEGWYYSDGTDGKNKQEKTADEVLTLISGTTELVKEAASKIDTVNVTKDGDNTVYTYELPAYLAKKYLKQLAKQTNHDDLSKITVDIEQATLISTVDAGGILKAQTIQVSGTLHKMLLLIPASAEFTAVFQVPDDGTPDIETW